MKKGRRQEKRSIDGERSLNKHRQKGRIGDDWARNLSREENSPRYDRTLLPGKPWQE